jgi:hypothetical protein
MVSSWRKTEQSAVEAYAFGRIPRRALFLAPTDTLMIDRLAPRTLKDVTPYSAVTMGDYGSTVSLSKAGNAPASSR